MGQDTGERKEKSMQEKLKPGDIVEGTFGKMEFVENFLPRPENLVLKKEKPPITKKVTVVLDEFTVRVFKEKAEELGGSYQSMIRKLLFEYARAIKNDEQNLGT